MGKEDWVVVLFLPKEVGKKGILEGVQPGCIDECPVQPSSNIRVTRVVVCSCEGSSNKANIQQPRVRKKVVKIPDRRRIGR